MIRAAIEYRLIWPIGGLLQCLLLASVILANGCRPKPDALPRDKESNKAANSETTGAKPDQAAGQPSKSAPAGMSFELLMFTARDHFRAGRLAAAEKVLWQAWQARAEDVEVNRALAQVINAQGRRAAARPFLLQLVKLGQFTVEDLVMLGSPDIPFYVPELLERAAQAQPSDPSPRLSEAQTLAREGKSEEVVRILEPIVKFDPENLEAQGLLGLTLLDMQNAAERLTAWTEQLPKQASQSARVWYVRGQWASRQGQTDQAIRAYWEAVKLDPNDRSAHYHLGLLLQERDPQLATPFLERAQWLAELFEIVHPIFFGGSDPALMERAFQTTQALGRQVEAYGWSVALASATSGAEQARWRQTQNELKARLAEAPATVAVDRQQQAMLDGLPLPQGGKFSEPEREASPTIASGNPIRFRDVADSLGIQHAVLAPTTDRGVITLFETTGCGVAVLDYDMDGWPDIYLTQRTTWPIPSESPYRDRLYRNQGDGTFADVTELAGVGDTGYSQGVTAGDFDNDGFPDLYVANIGANRLFHNNGDGTFREAPLPTIARKWTTSCLIADLNGDGFPDLYDVNYLAGDDVYTRTCEDHGRQIACGPSRFPGEPDTLWLSQGEMAWSDATEAAGLQRLTGKGLGVVAMRHEQGKLALFVANDAVANHFLVPLAGASGELKYNEQALLLGLASDRDGRNQACMGVAAGDCDGDGLLDLFVTNYINDYNTLYKQTPGYLFVDSSRQAQLREPSLQQLGFGTQFIDADLDGDLDLVVGNGHVDDFQFLGVPYRMKPQLFRNLGRGEFVDESDDGGAYFQQPRLARGLARLDWNRDGRAEFVVSQIGDPASVTVNETQTTGSFLRLSLSATQTARDGIGARIQVTAGDFQQVCELTGGDGYQCHNESVVQIGVPTAEVPVSLTIQWPSGNSQTWPSLASGCEYRLVEGDLEAYPLPLR